MIDTQLVKAIIFDLDGVLLTTDKYHYIAWKQLADELDIPFCEKDNEAFRGVSRMDCMEILLTKKPELVFSEEQKIAYANKKNQAYIELLAELDRETVDTEVRSTLSALRARGYRLAVGSSSKNAKYILRKVELDGMFDAIIGGDDIVRSKPDPEVFIKAAEAVGVSPCNSAVVEDAEAGLQAAVDGGMLPIAMGAAKGSHMARISLETFGELDKIFLGNKEMQ